MNHEDDRNKYIKLAETLRNVRGLPPALAQQRRSDGFRCPRCGHDHGYTITTRRRYECSQCHSGARARVFRLQASLTAGTLFHSTNLSLTKWFCAIYLAISDKGGISAMRLAKQIGISWLTASRMLRKIRIAMGHRDSLYRLHDLIEIDDVLVSGYFILEEVGSV